MFCSFTKKNKKNNIQTPDTAPENGHQDLTPAKKPK